MTKARSTRGIQGDTACPAICGHTGRAEEGPRAKAASKGRGGGNQKEGESRGEAFSPSDGVKTRRVAERRKTQTVRESERREREKLKREFHPSLEKAVSEWRGGRERANVRYWNDEMTKGKIGPNWQDSQEAHHGRHRREEENEGGSTASLGRGIK